MPNNSFLAQEVWEGAGTPHIHQSLVPPGPPPRCREPGASSANTAGVQGGWKPEPHCFVWGGPHPRAWGAGAAGSWTPTAQLWEWGPDATQQGRRQAALLVHPPVGLQWGGSSQETSGLPPLLEISFAPCPLPAPSSSSSALSPRGGSRGILQVYPGETTNQGSLHAGLCPGNVLTSPALQACLPQSLGGEPVSAAVCPRKQQSGAPRPHPSG